MLDHTLQTLERLGVTETPGAVIADAGGHGPIDEVQVNELYVASAG